VSSPGVVVGLTLSLVAPLSARQQPVMEAADSQTKYQMSQYETALRGAVLRAGQQLSERANSIVPGVQLSLESEPIVRFVPTPEGPVFDVQIPRLLDTGPSIMRMYQARPPQPTSPAVPVAQTPDRVTGAGVVQPDPMTNSPVQNFDPDRDYSAFAREALIDALIDNSGAVPLKEGQRLEIVATGLDIFPNPIAPETSRRLILVVTAADLVEYRQGKISRDEVKGRIKESRY